MGVNCEPLYILYDDWRICCLNMSIKTLYAFPDRWRPGPGLLAFQQGRCDLTFHRRTMILNDSTQAPLHRRAHKSTLDVTRRSGDVELTQASCAALCIRLGR
ncbi:hypothetical protein PMIN03_000937 [Paraphaeosphaeria minitans]